jgi:hypothetical protein
MTTIFYTGQNNILGAKYKDIKLDFHTIVDRSRPKKELYYGYNF